jgi:transaldolase
MIGRLDDYVRKVAHDNRSAAGESDIRQAGLRGDYHLTELAGADLLMSIHPDYQGLFVSQELPCEERIDRPVSAEAIDRLRRMPEFVRFYEPDGMAPREFIGLRAAQGPLASSPKTGWKLMESYR